jgi:hypothetical protein
MKPLTVEGFLLRFLFALLLVLLTYNPSGYSYAHWLENSFSNFGPLLAIAGISLIIGWVIYIRATLRSLGLVGLILAGLFFGAIVWLFIDWGWLSLDNVNAVSWVILILLSAVLAVGISWSHIRRKISGQVDADDVDEES